MIKSCVALVVLTSGVWWTSILPAVARCAGENLLSDYRVDRPEQIDAMFSRAHAVPNAKGLFWEVRKGDLPASHLFGTFHAAEVVETTPDYVWDALENARVAIFEIDLNQKSAMERRMRMDPGFALDFQAEPLDEIVPLETLPDLSSALARRGVKMDAAAQMRPWLLISLLGFPACHLQAVAAGAEALDLVMAKRAHSTGVTVLSLETYEQSVAALSSTPKAAIYAEIANAARMDRISEDLFQTNIELYRTGEVQAVIEFSIWLAQHQHPGPDYRRSSEALMSQLLDRRNQEWMPKILSEFATGGAFVGVGALHLPGMDGLIELLRAEGYDVRRVD
ncbi:MAG: TraB/GumN family protein [Pseudomonadota bacterium]